LTRNHGSTKLKMFHGTTKITLVGFKKKTGQQRSVLEQFTDPEVRMNVHLTFTTFTTLGSCSGHVLLSLACRLAHTARREKDETARRARRQGEARWHGGARRLAWRDSIVMPTTASVQRKQEIDGLLKVPAASNPSR